MRLQLLAFWRLPRKEPQEGLVLRLDLLAGYAEEFGSFSGPGTHDVFTLAIVIVGGIVVTQPLGAIAHFSHNYGSSAALFPRFRARPPRPNTGRVGTNEETRGHAGERQRIKKALDA